MTAHITCPIMRSTFDEDDGWGSSVACGADLYLSVSHTYSVDYGSASIVALDPSKVSDEILTSRWELVCTEGHVLAVSQGEEHAEPFRLDKACSMVMAPTPSPVDIFDEDEMRRFNEHPYNIAHGYEMKRL